MLTSGNMPIDQQHTDAVPSTPFAMYAGITLCMFVFSFLGSFLVTNWSTVNTLYYEASLAKFEAMSGESGPTTYLIAHNDYSALQAMADKHAGILSVEQNEGSTVARMAFGAGMNALVKEVEQLPAVTSMINVLRLLPTIQKATQLL